MLKKVCTVCCLFLFFYAVCSAAPLAEEQKFNTNYTGINGEKLSFDYEEGSSQIIVKNKSVKTKPIDMILTLKSAPDETYLSRVMSLHRLDVAGKSFWYLKTYWIGTNGAASANTQFWLIGQCKGKIVPYATEKILGEPDVYDTLSIISAQAYRRATTNGVFNPEPVLLLDRFSDRFERVDTTVLFWDEDAQWFSYTGKYLYPYPVYVDGKLVS